ncbi:glycosyltransferase [Amycolatopsis sp. WAC 01416]|uniref:glycosyltransferase n=1 Tax=Amycolatopsis sp. WAC 01416 TaxID=2203196 RepID=UPI0013153572|nr:glycosyltransferase [Amycolatopsis sp. WAC 01416]
MTSNTLPVVVVVLARDEQRCIARCLNSVVGRGFDRVIVADTGSVDHTPRIVEEYKSSGVELMRVPWTDSFAEARNSAVDAAGSGWIVFLDADEWLVPDAPDRLLGILRTPPVVGDLSRTAFAPIIYDVVRDSWVDQVPRIFLADGGIRFRGAVHEYLAVGDRRDESIELVSTKVEFRHDGYSREVIHAKRKTERNLSLLRSAIAAEPQDPRWVYFTVRDALPFLSPDELMRHCETLRRMASQEVRTGDHVLPSEYLRRALAFACQSLTVRGEWRVVERYCAEIDELDSCSSPDAQYFRAMIEGLGEVVTDRTLKETISVRKNEALLGKSTLCPAGRHLDAAIAALVERRFGLERAEEYRAMCLTWDDMIFDQSKLRVQPAL